MKDYAKPTPRHREEIMSPGQFYEILDVVRDQEFRDLLVFSRETGTRPSEAMAVEARHIHFDQSAIVLDSKTSRSTGRSRVILLTPEATAICRRLSEAWPEGPIFRNTIGKPWSRTQTKNRFTKIRRKLGFGREATLESLRHEWITDGLEAGIPIKTMSELAGHSSTAMIDKTYSKLHSRKQHMKDALAKVRPSPTSPNETVDRQDES